MRVSLRAPSTHGSAWRAFTEYTDFQRAHPELDLHDRNAWVQARMDELKLALRHRKRNGMHADRRYFANHALPMFRLN